MWFLVVVPVVVLAPAAIGGAIGWLIGRWKWPRVWVPVVAVVAGSVAAILLNRSGRPDEVPIVTIGWAVVLLPILYLVAILARRSLALALASGGVGGLLVV